MKRQVDRRQFVVGATALTLTRTSAGQGRAPEAPPLVIAVGADRYSIDPQRFTFTVRGPHAQVAETPVRPDANFLPGPASDAGRALLDAARYLEGLR